MRHRLLAGLTTAVVLVAAAALASAMTPAGSGPAVSAQYECTAAQLVADLGVGKLQEDLRASVVEANGRRRAAFAPDEPSRKVNRCARALG